MDLDSLMRNIRQVNVEEEIKKAVSRVKCEYANLITEQTCKIYSSLLYEELNSNHIPTRIISTGDLGLTYDHMFLLVNSSDIKYYLIDLTYDQFKNNEFNKLIENGYQEISNQDINKYLKIVSRDDNDLDLDSLYYGKRKNI